MYSICSRKRNSVSSVRSNFIANALDTISALSPSRTRSVSYTPSPRSIVTFMISRFVKKPEVLEIGCIEETCSEFEGGGIGLAFASEPSSFEEYISL